MRKARRTRSKKKIVIIVILVIILAGIAAFFGYHAKQFRDQKRYRRHMVNAYEKEDYKLSLEYQKDIDKTTNLFSGLLRRDVDYYEADCYVKLEQYDKAMAIYEQLINEEPEDAKAYMLKGNCYMKKEDVKKALEIYKTGYNNTKDTVFLPNLAYCYISLENYEMAREVIREGLSLEEESIKKDLLFDEIILYEKELDYESAYEKAKAYVELYPDDEEGVKELTFLETR